MPAPMKKDVMTDLETLGKGAGCKILSIGAVEFSTDGLGREFYTAVRIDAGQDELHTNADTQAWWDKQSPEARKVFKECAAKKTPELAAALTNFAAWLHAGIPYSAVRVWGNGSDFDNAILNYAYDAKGIPLPWQFWNNRCLRTLRWIAPHIPKVPFDGTAHNALADAKNQALHAVEILRTAKKHGFAL